MAASHTPETKLDFDEKYLSKCYYDILETFSKKKPLDQLMRINWVSMMIGRVESTKKLIKNNVADVDLHPKAREALDKYEVIQDDTEKRLFVKSALGVLMEAIPLTKTYPIVREAHTVTGHGGVSEMSEMLEKSKKYVSPYCLPAIIKGCPECQINLQKDDEPKIHTSLLNKPEGDIGKQCIPPLITINQPDFQHNNTAQLQSIKKINECSAQVTLIDMAVYNKCEAFGLDNLLFYRDMSSGFLQLRPVCSLDTIESVTTELTQIVSDMGPPKTIIVPRSNSHIMTQVLGKVVTLINTEIKIELRDVVAPNAVKKVNTAMKNWMEKQEKNNWVLGCFIIQWELNITPDRDGKSPYERVFGRSVDKDVVDLTSVMQNNSIVQSIDNLQINNSPALAIDDYIAENPVLEIPAELTKHLH